MIIEFKEIPEASGGGGLQDTFELFSRDYIELLGFEIIGDPSRGADGGLDFKVKEVRTGVGGKTEIFWLASCKHYAHSGKSVSPSDEINIRERLETFGCDGFLGIYSTIASSGLIRQLDGMATSNKLERHIYDREKIERSIIGVHNLEHLFVRYFPKSFKQWKEAYYYTEPIKLFENFVKSKYENESLIKVFYNIFGSTGNFIKALRKYDKFEDALIAYDYNVILDETFHSYQHRQDSKYIEDKKPFQFQAFSQTYHSNVFSSNNFLLKDYKEGTIRTTGKRFVLVSYDGTNERLDKVKYKYGINRPSRLFYFEMSWMLNSSLYLYSNLLIVDKGHYDHAAEVYSALKDILI